MATTSRLRQAVRTPMTAEPAQGNLRRRFRPLAQARVTGVLAALDYFAQLSQRNRYHYTDAEVDVLMSAIMDKVGEVEAAFREGRGNRPTFSWDAAAVGEDE
jgi:hypothetical protein